MSKKPEKPKTCKAARRSHDPVFALIAFHKALMKEWHRLNEELDNDELNAMKLHGNRSWPLIAWRNYSAIGGDELDRARDEFLREPGADHEQVEKEYQDAKAREAAAERAGIEWDLRAGIAPLREQFERTSREELRAAGRLVRTKPDSVAGAAALLAYLTRRKRVYGGFEGWEIHVLRFVAAALARMSEAA